MEKVYIKQISGGVTVDIGKTHAVSITYAPGHKNQDIESIVLFGGCMFLIGFSMALFIVTKKLSEFDIK